jgi:hypothetical protein
MEELTKAERIAWDQYIRGLNDWKEHELRRLHMVVKRETQLEELREQCRHEPYKLEKTSSTGDVVFYANPIHAEYNKAETGLLALVRSIGLQVSDKGARRRDNEGVPALLAS